MRRALPLAAALALVSVLLVPASADAMQLFVKDLAGDHVCLEVEPTDAISDVWDKIQREAGVSPDAGHLFFAGTELSNMDSTLQEYGIPRDSTLRLVEHDFTCVGNGDGTHSRTCSVLGCAGNVAAEPCHGGHATCARLATCEACGQEYGALDPSRHEALEHVGAVVPTDGADGVLEHWRCVGCGALFLDAAGTEEVSWDDLVVPRPGVADGPEGDVPDNAGDAAGGESLADDEDPADDATDDGEGAFEPEEGASSQGADEAALPATGEAARPALLVPAGLALLALRRRLQ